MFNFKRSDAASAAPLLSLSGCAHGYKKDIGIDHFICVLKGTGFMSVNALRFQDIALSYGFPRLDMEGVMPYS